MNTKSLFNISAVAILVLGMTACDSNDSISVYIPEARTLQIRNFNLRETLNETFHVAITGGDYPTASGMEAATDIKVSLSVMPEKVDEYNKVCGTKYSILPADCYSIANSGIISAGTTISAGLSLSINAAGKIMPFDSYLLPITISTAEGAACGDIQQTLYYLLSGAEDVWNMPLADRSSWTIVEVSSEETSGEGSDNGHAIHAFDDNNNTFWHTQWKGNEDQPPHHITIDMGKEVKMLGFQFMTRNHGEGWPQEITLETSVDSVNWETAGTYSDLPAGGGEEFRAYLPGFKQARFFRLTITAVYNGKWSTHIAEINAISM